MHEPTDDQARRPRHARAAWVTALGLLAGIMACTPTVKVEAPKEPIVINLNVKIEHEVRVKVEKDVEQLLEKESDLF